MDPKVNELKRLNSKSTTAKLAFWLNVQPRLEPESPGDTIEVARSAVDAEFLELADISSGSPIGKLFGYNIKIVPDFRMTDSLGNEKGWGKG